MESHLQAVETLCRQVYLDVISAQFLKIVLGATFIHEPLFHMQFYSIYLHPILLTLSLQTFPVIVLLHFNSLDLYWQGSEIVDF